MSSAVYFDVMAVRDPGLLRTGRTAEVAPMRDEFMTGALRMILQNSQENQASRRAPRHLPRSLSFSLENLSTIEKAIKTGTH